METGIGFRTALWHIPACWLRGAVELSILYVVGTPIGNLEDVSFRCVRVLREVSLIAAEDTRITRRLLSRYEISTPLTSYHEHNRLSKLPAILEALDTGDVALVTDAGMPGISDPGAELVARAAEAGHAVESVPGPSAVTAAVSVSGLSGDGFVFVGFLPREKARRLDALRQVAAERRLVVLYEAPHRIAACLRDVLDTLGDRRIAVCREITKLHEETFRGRVSEAIEHFAQPRGEFTIVIEGAGELETPTAPEGVSAHEVALRLRGEGASSKDAVRAIVSEANVSRREAYRVWLESAP